MHIDEARMEALLCQAPDGEDLAAPRHRILSGVLAFVGDALRSDDITLLLIRRDR